MSQRSKIPWLTLCLIGLNVATAFLLVFRPDIEADFGFVASKPSLLTGLTSLFIHANLLHLLGNMLFLAAVGPLIEFSKGPFRFALIYFVGGVAGVLGHWALMGRFPGVPPLIGASAAIAACVAFASVAHFRKRVPIAPGIGISVGAIAVIWVLLQALGGWVRLGEQTGTGTAFWAHLSGFLAGLLMSAILRVGHDQSLQLGHEVLDRMNDHGPATMLAAADLHLAKHPDDRRAMREKAKALEELGRVQEAIEITLKLAQSAPEADQPELVAKLAKLDGLGILPSYRRIQWAEELKLISNGSTLLLLQSVADEPDTDPKKPEALFLLAELLIEIDPVRSEQFLSELGEKYSLHEVAEMARKQGLLR